MTDWGDGSVLFDLVERQFAHLFALRGPERLLFLSRLLQFVESEPRLSGILEDLRVEADAALGSFQVAEGDIRKELASLWATHKAEVLARLEAARSEDRADRMLDTFCPIESYEERLAAAPAPAFPSLGNTAELESDTEKLITAMKQWRSWAGSEAETAGESLSATLEKVDGIVAELEKLQTYAARELHLASRNLGWPALGRLRHVRALVQPTPPQRGSERSAAWGIERVRFDDADQVARAIHAEGNASSNGQRRVAELIDEVGADAKTLQEEIILRIGRGRSRVALVRRYAARCEAFDAERLRAACAKTPTKAERLLTNDFARFLFDAGLSPLLSASASGLQPDVLHVEPASLFYIEAKQYQGKNPRAQIKKAYAQVCSTW